MAAEYAYKPGAIVSAPPNVAGAVMKELEKTVGLTAKTLLDASRPQSAPLHYEFEWDDGIAAEKYRESQAGYIIRVTVVTREDDPGKKTRAFVSIKEDKKMPTYMAIDTVLQTDSLREKLLASALRELEAFRYKYQQLSELAAVFEAFDMIRGRHNAPTEVSTCVVNA